MTSDHWNERYADPELVWSAAPNRFLVSEVELMEPGRVLDLACGEGRNAVWLAGRGWQVTGVDFSHAGIDKARRMAEAHGVEVEWAVADLIHWQPAPAAFDLVIIFYLHIPPPDRRAILASAAAALAPGGTLLVVGHALRNLTDGYGGPPAADLLYSPEELASDLAGLVIERAVEVERPVEVEGATRMALDVLVRARRA